MARQNRKMEGNEEQRRAAARDAREQGKLPSEMKATTGASKQRKEAPENASHQERLEQKHEGKSASSRPGERARPGSRDVDPNRSGDEG
jgi:hypothetical protein